MMKQDSREHDDEKIGMTSKKLSAIRIIKHCFEKLSFRNV